jgi:hypothetical protein
MNWTQIILTALEAGRIAIWLILAYTEHLP